MRSSYYVIFNRHGIDRFAKTDSFTLKQGEYAVQMQLDIPDDLFVSPPVPVARLTLTREMLMRQLSASIDTTPALEAEFTEEPRG